MISNKQAEVTGVTVNGSHFVIKTEYFGDYEFNVQQPYRAQKWKSEIDTRIEQAKLVRTSVQENEKYKESLASFKEAKGI